MTPPDQHGRTGQGPERDADSTFVIASDGQAKPVEPAGGTRESGYDGGHDGNGNAGTPPGTHVVGAEDLELSHSTPPPWQRVTNDTQQQGQRTTPATPSTNAGETTVTVERPVVTGSAASRLFGDPASPTTVHGTPPPSMPGLGTPPQGIPSAAAPPRTTVHLEGSPSSTGPLRAVTPGAAAPSALRRPGRGPRRANLQIKRFDPWSVLKLSLVLSVALFFVWLVAVGVLYAVLDGMGVWDKLNGISSEILAPAEDGGTADPLISAGRVFGVAAIIGAVNIVLFSALATVGAFIYNVSADLAGGLEVTLAERE